MGCVNLKSINKDKSYLEKTPSIENYDKIKKVEITDSKKSKDLLKSFCANSNFVKNKLSQKVIGELESVGVKVSDAGKFGWVRREYVLNYMLQSYENC